MDDEGLRLRETLTELREQAAERLDSVSTELEGLLHDRSVSNDDDEHDPEGAPLSTEWSRLTGLAEGVRAKLQQVDDALARLDAGTFGVCVSCGKPIPAGRLEVRPFADHCVPCAERLAR